MVAILKKRKGERQTTDVPFVVFLTAHLNELKKGPQGKNKLNTERCDRIRTFQSQASVEWITSKAA